MGGRRREGWAKEKGPTDAPQSLREQGCCPGSTAGHTQGRCPPRPGVGLGSTALSQKGGRLRHTSALPRARTAVAASGRRKALPGTLHGRSSSAQCTRTVRAWERTSWCRGGAGTRRAMSPDTGLGGSGPAPRPSRLLPGPGPGQSEGTAHGQALLPRAGLLAAHARRPPLPSSCSKGLLVPRPSLSDAKGGTSSHTGSHRGSSARASPPARMETAFCVRVPWEQEQGAGIAHEPATNAT